jgi:DNA-binding HxlR family transcriptional regulator
MAEQSYQQFCPLAMTSEVLGGRWTILLLSELLAGSSRFNDLRRGVPRMSPTLLSRRLRELEADGIIMRRPVTGEPGVMEYVPTPSGEELRPILRAMGEWGHRWTGSEPQLEHLDASLLMWNMRRKIMLDQLPKRRTVIQFIYPEQAEPDRNWWIMAEPRRGTDLCCVDPGFDVDLYVRTDLRTMTAVYMGLEDYRAAVESGRLLLIGDTGLEKDMLDWLGLSSYASLPKCVA